MAIDETKRFTFVSQGMPDDTFAVVEFKGIEGISKLYEFDITLASDDGEIDLKGVLQNPATLTIKGGDQDLPIHGAVAQFEQLNEVKGHYFYRALLVPRLRQADLYHENQLFLDKKVPDIIEEILKQAGLTTQDYELKLTRNYPQWEYICQYRETDFDFICRWMEREGIYYYFEQGEQNEKIIITDSSTAHKDIPGDAKIPYFTASGLAPEEEAIKALVCTQKMLPKKVILKDYNYRKPSLELKAEAEVDSKGRGDVYLYGEHFKDPGQGNELAKIRAEEIKCRENIFHGEGTAPNLCPGFFFTLDGHYRDSYNQKYLILEVEHEGHQTGAFWSGVGEKPAEGEEKLTYANSFTAIPSDVQFRPERTTPKSKFSGTMNATVDAAGDGKNAEVDDQGRYKIILPFDQSGNKDGKASRWVRMAQPYAGSEYGMHFPLHKGAEVLLTFVDGDPDRPIISGSVPNPETTSPVTSDNQTTSVVRDNFGNEMIFDATPGDEHIRLYSPHHHSGIEIGKSIKSWTADDRFDYIDGNIAEVGYGTKASFYAGYTVDIAAAFSVNALVGIEHNILLGGSHEWIPFGYKWDWSRGPYVQKTNRDALFAAREDIILGVGDEFCLAAGTMLPDSGNENTSVMRATPDGVTLSLGKGLTETGEGIGKGDWYKPQGIWGKEEWLAMTSLVAGVLGGVSTAVAISGQAEKELPDWTMGFYAGNLLTLLSLIASAWLGAEVLADVKIEPVRHVDPAQKIWLHRDGTIGLVSTKGRAGARAVDGSKGRIVIGVNKQESTEKKDWRYYDSYRDFTKADVTAATKAARPLLKYADHRQEALDMLRQTAEHRSLGKGSNIIIEKDKIWLRSGEPGKESLEIVQLNEGNDKRIALYTYNPNKQEERARIAIYQDNGQIDLNNEKRDGIIALRSKKQIQLKTDDDIVLNAGGQKQIYIKSKSAFSGAIAHPNFKVLK
jgi:type VI secretion system VgrG family protein